MLLIDAAPISRSNSVGPGHLRELEHPSEGLHRLLAERLVLDLVEQTRVERAPRRFHRPHLDPPLDARQRRERAIVALPGAWSSGESRPARQLWGPCQPFQKLTCSSELATARPSRSDVDELRVLEDLVEESDAGPAGDLDQQAVALGGQHRLEGRVDLFLDPRAHVRAGPGRGRAPRSRTRTCPRSGSFRRGGSSRRTAAAAADCPWPSRPCDSIRACRGTYSRAAKATSSADASPAGGETGSSRSARSRR